MTCRVCQSDRDVSRDKMCPECHDGCHECLAIICDGCDKWFHRHCMASVELALCKWCFEENECFCEAEDCAMCREQARLRREAADRREADYEAAHYAAMEGVTYGE